MGLARIARGRLLVAVAFGSSTRALVAGIAVLTGGSAFIGPSGLTRAAAGEGPLVSADLTIFADTDDDDLDGAADGAQASVPARLLASMVKIPDDRSGAYRTLVGAAHARAVVGGKPVSWDAPVRTGTRLQGVSPGRLEAIVVGKGGDQRPIRFDVLAARFSGWRNEAVDAVSSHAQIARTPPAPLEGGVTSRHDDPDALRLVVEGPKGAALPEFVVASLSSAGQVLDVLRRPALTALPCRSGDAALECRATVPIRFVQDDVDRRHPLVEARSIRAEVGGAVAVYADGKKVHALRVRGPRESPAGPIGRMRAKIRVLVSRVSPGGAPSVGTNDVGALAQMRTELRAAGSVWGQCGVSFGPVDNIDVRVVDVPPSHLVAFGADLGFPAARGGRLRAKIEKREVSVVIPRGADPGEAATLFAHAVGAAGYRARVSENTRILPGAARSVDVSVQKPGGGLASVELLEPFGDPMLVVRIGRVDLSDGLDHFTDMDSMAGTLEERTLVKAYDDGDPSTVDLYVVPSFRGGGRIGESFIYSDGSSVRNVVLLDRAGVRARKSSLTLAHELGHVLLDLPGHPDDFGVDTPTLLMDSDASDASAYGPRRLTVAECARAVRATGPASPTPVLVPWSLGPIEYPPL